MHSDAVRVLSRIEPVGHRRQLCRVETDAEVGPQLLVERLDGHVLASKDVQADATAVWIVVLRARVDFLQRPVRVGLRERRRDLVTLGPVLAQVRAQSLVLARAHLLLR